MLALYTCCVSWRNLPISEFAHLKQTYDLDAETVRAKRSIPLQCTAERSQVSESVDNDEQADSYNKARENTGRRS